MSSGVVGQTFIYAIGGPSGPMKIGFSSQPQRRLKQIQTSTHERLEIHAVAAVDDCWHAEREAHRLLGDRRIYGEWFDVTPAVAADAIKVAAATPAKAGQVSVSVKVPGDLMERLEQYIAAYPGRTKQWVAEQGLKMLLEARQTR